MRSATANVIYDADERFLVKSAGTKPTAKIVLNRELLDWADTIVVMERHHRNSIRHKFPDAHDLKKIVCLYIPDIYDYMQPELISLLKVKFENLNRKGLI